MSDFSDRPFMAGSLIGLRAFQADKLGRLTGITHADVFRPGENTAACRSTKVSLSGVPDGSQVEIGPSYTFARFGPQPVEVIRENGTREFYGSADDLARRYPPKEPDHQVAERDCQCGFYAYFDGKNDYHGGSTDYTVQAVIEGYGVCTVGTRGFRASKARLVALVDPLHESTSADPEPDAEPERRTGWVRRAWNYGWLALSLLSLLVGVVSGSLFTITVGSLSVGMWASIIWGPRLVRRFKKPDSSPTTSITWHVVRPSTPITDVRWARVRANYPDVPVYPTLAAALAAHPLTVPPREPLPTPETHEDFWDMAVPS